MPKSACEMFRVVAAPDPAAVGPRFRPVDPRRPGTAVDAGRARVPAGVVFRVGVAAGLLAVLVGCAGPAPTVSAPSGAGGAFPSIGAGPITTAPATTVPADPSKAVCASETGSTSTVRGIADAARKEPVLPAAVALFLLDARQKAAAPGITDPALKTSLTELVAAIDDLDAQGQAGLPPGGNPAQDKVKLDVTRITAAVDAVDKACAPHRG